MNYRFHPDALQEIEEAAEFYLFKGGKLKVEFAAAIKHAINEIVDRPRAFPQILEKYRRCLVRRFPYAIVFEFEGNDILIVAVTHTHHDPGYWLYRLES